MESGGGASTILANGLRVIEMPMPGRLATAVALAFPGGARHEEPQEVGIAHLLEHMAFKGAAKHPFGQDAEQGRRAPRDRPRGRDDAGSR